MASVNRRTFLTTAASATALLASPALVREARASSGVINYIGWAGLDYSPVFDGFEKATGIRINLIAQPEQDTMLAQCRLAVQDGSGDIALPGHQSLPSWYSLDIVQPFDTTRLDVTKYLPGMTGTVEGDVGWHNGAMHFVPSSWGTEALIYQADDPNSAYGTASLEHLFSPDYQGMVTVRAHSALAALGRVLEAQGKLPMPFRDSYASEQAMRQVWDVILAEAIPRKRSVGQFWGSETEAQGAFLANGCTLGLNWESTGQAIASDGFTFIAPKEGAFAWSQGYVLLKNARNTDQVYEFLKYVSDPAVAALVGVAEGASPVIKGSTELLPPEIAEFQAKAYPGDAVEKMWWWPPQDTWFLKLRGEYADKWRSA